MLSKEECEKALNELITNNIYNFTNKQFIRKEILENKKMSEEVLNQLIQEHFELVEVLKETGWDGFNADELKTIIKAGQYNSEKLNSLRNLQGKYFQDMKVDHLRQYARKGVKIRWRYRIVKELSDL